VGANKPPPAVAAVTRRAVGASAPAPRVIGAPPAGQRWNSWPAGARTFRAPPFLFNEPRGFHPRPFTQCAKCRCWRVFSAPTYGVLFSFPRPRAGGRQSKNPQDQPAAAKKRCVSRPIDLPLRTAPEKNPPLLPYTLRPYQSYPILFAHPARRPFPAQPHRARPRRAATKIWPFQSRLAGNPGGIKPYHRNHVIDESGEKRRRGAGDPSGGRGCVARRFAVAELPLENRRGESGKFPGRRRSKFKESKPGRATSLILVPCRSNSKPQPCWVKGDAVWPKARAPETRQPASCFLSRYPSVA